MFGLFLYALVCALVAVGLVALRTLVTRVSKIGENSNAVRLVVTWLVVMALPYGWVEVQTRMHKQEFAGIVDQVAEKKLIEGDPAYFKVQSDMNGKARLLVVATGENHWGGTFRNVYGMRLHKDAKGWLLESVDPINTTDGDSAGFTVPPYW